MGAGFVAVDEEEEEDDEDDEDEDEDEDDEDEDEDEDEETEALLGGAAGCAPTMAACSAALSMAAIPWSAFSAIFWLVVILSVELNCPV